ncbi:hypothetical protein EI171_00600 (plasmid) [Bradyrhizobium sp. LCT2]|uniref:hypothetical protein n=1 Tax=Bradyrhizobium sp. LCT2 TaxID=2493093 RepID=UPI001373F079|nr:hypothetical protein [Bradyrhizobium sp. LCT2]QHP66082.1 hypothetical protein EI171_00600 [Bradyrhizobium sp. LCT2]
MFLKADGTKVWLRSSPRLPYLSFAGVIETPEDYPVIRSRLLEVYKQYHGTSSDDAFVVWDEDGSALIFCATSDKNCALLLLGEFGRSGKEKPIAVLDDLVNVVNSSLTRIARHTHATIRLQTVKPELAIGAG